MFRPPVTTKTKGYQTSTHLPILPKRYLTPFFILDTVFYFQNGYQTVIGIDVSKAKLDVANGSGGTVETIDNDAATIRGFIAKHFTNPTSTLVVVEATGGYESLLVMRK